VVVTPRGTYSTLWQDDRLSGGWQAYDTLSKTQYEKKITALGKSGWHVIRVTLHGWLGTTVKDDHGNDVVAYHYDGAFPGTAALIFHRADGISFVLLFNRDAVPYLWGGVEAEGEQLNDLADQVTDWPSEDLFPSYGIPSF
jgi:hypothetical protein